MFDSAFDNVYYKMALTGQDLNSIVVIPQLNGNLMAKNCKKRLLLIIMGNICNTYSVSMHHAGAYTCIGQDGGSSPSYEFTILIVFSK